MADEKTKHEILAELKAERWRFVRNVTALSGLGLLVGCTTAINPLVGGIVAGSLMFAIGVTAMIFTRPRRTKDE